MRLEEILDEAELRRLIAENYITARDHPALPYQILNYTPKTQFARHWTAETELSRGLMVDTRDGTIIGWPFRKFFNWGEREVVLPDEPFGCRRWRHAARSRRTRPGAPVRSCARRTPTRSRRCWRSAG
jgi:hypothetical protein